MRKKNNLVELVAERWEIEWTSEMPIDPDTGDADIDNAVFSRKSFATKAEAMSFAKSLFAGGKLADGDCVINRQEPAIDAGTLEHEGRSVVRWYDRETAWLTEIEDCRVKTPMEPVIP